MEYLGSYDELYQMSDFASIRLIEMPKRKVYQIEGKLMDQNKVKLLHICLMMVKKGM